MKRFLLLAVVALLAGMTLASCEKNEDVDTKKGQAQSQRQVDPGSNVPNR